MTRLFGALAVGVLALGFTAGPALAENKSGEAKFTGPNKESYKVKAGAMVKLDVDLKQIAIGPQSAVSVSGKVKNTAGVKMYYSYNVAFLDKDKNLIGCQNFNLFLDPGKEAGVGTFINLPPAEIKKIAYYSIAFHESDAPIGSK